MLYMIQLKYPIEKRDKLREHFEAHGVTGHADGLVLMGAWVAKTRHAFALVEAHEEHTVRQVCSAWSQFGTVSYLPVIDISQIM